MSRRLAISLGILGLSVATCLSADKHAAAGRASSVSWPQWRGPQRDDISPAKGLLKKWPKDGPKVAWKANGMGSGFASVAIADGRIITTGDRDGKQQIIAVSLDGGSPLWTAVLGEPWNGDKKGARSTPTIDGDRVYVISTHGDLVCVEAADGGEVWRKSFPKEFQGKVHSGWGYCESPLVDGDRVVCTPGGPDAAIVALDKKDGKEIWRCSIPDLGPSGNDGAGYSSIVISRAAGVKQYVQLVGRGVVGVSEGGKFLWGYNRIANTTANIPTPLVKDDYIFCSTGYGTGAALLKLVRSGDGVKANEVYFLDGNQLQNHHGGMVMLGNFVYCGHGHNGGAPTCVEWKTGKIVWRQDHGPGTGSAAVAYADGELYFRYQSGVMALIDATNKGYQEKGTFQIPDSREPSWAHPVIIGGKLYLREQDALLAYDLQLKH